MAEMGLFTPDALNESIGLELDMLNILYGIPFLLIPNYSLPVLIVSALCKFSQGKTIESEVFFKNVLIILILCIL
jgi:hypothetical protein